MMKVDMKTIRIVIVDDSPDFLESASRFLADQPELSGPSYISKLYWARLHRDLGELAIDVLGADAGLCAEGSSPSAYELTDAQKLFLFTRSDTIYGGSNQVQRNIIGERALGLPPEPKVLS